MSKDIVRRRTSGARAFPPRDDAIVGMRIHEIKHDGYRLIARKRDGRVNLFTRNGFDWTERYPLIHSAAAALRVTSAVVDGEAVCCDEAGVAVFERLHSRAHDDQVFLFYAFDLLELDGEDWRPRPLRERKAKLAKLLANARTGIQFSHIDGDGATGNFSPRGFSPDMALAR
jgi:bifunctional non-homologous end joining protein LigD